MSKKIALAALMFAFAGSALAQAPMAGGDQKPAAEKKMDKKEHKKGGKKMAHKKGMKDEKKMGDEKKMDAPAPAPAPATK